METKDFSFEFKSVDGEQEGTFEGVLATYGNLDRTGDVCDYGCFSKTLMEGGGRVPLLWSHDVRQPIGTLVLRDSPLALHAKGKLLLQVPQAAAAYQFLKHGVVKGLSIGYSTIKAIPGENGVRRLKELKLFEGSLVLIPANELATVTAVKAAEEDEGIQELEMFRNAARDIRQFYEKLL